MSRFRNIRVKMANGKSRIQRAMVLASGKLKFVKRGGKSSSRKRHHKKGHKHVAKRRRKSHRRGGGRRRSHSRSMVGGLVPGGRDTMYLAAGAAGIGWVEGKSKTDPTFIANKIPKFIDALGFTGNTTLVVHLLNKFLIKNRYVDYIVRGGTIVTGYQLARRGKAFDKADEVFTISGDDDYLSGPEAYLDEATVGALAAEAEISGIPFDDAVHEALEHT